MISALLRLLGLVASFLESATELRRGQRVMRAAGAYFAVGYMRGTFVKEIHECARLSVGYALGALVLIGQMA